MIRGLVILSAFVAACLAFPVKSSDVIPAEYKEFVTSLTEDDKKVLKEIAVDYAKYKNEDEVLAAVKEKSPALHAKFEKFRIMLKEKFDALGDEAKAFAKEVINEARKNKADAEAGNKPSREELKAKIMVVIEKYKALSDDAKADLEKQFPITVFFKNENLPEIINEMLEKN